MPFLLLLTVCAAMAAGPSDPFIPSGEAITYEVTVDDARSVMTETTVVITDNGTPAYRLTSLSPSDDKVITIRKHDMVATGYRHAWRNDGTVITREHALAAEGKVFGNGDIAAIHYHVLPYVFRGFPFGKGNRLDILMMGGNDPMRLYVKYDGTAVVETDAGAIDCHRLEMGMSGFVGSVVPKSQYWYSTAPPYYMVKYQGSSGPPGSPKKTVLLKTYSAER